MLKKIAMGLGGLIVVLVVVGLFLPSGFSAQRSTVINAPVDVIFNQVVDFQNHAAWSPWEAADSTIKTTYGEITMGVGAKASWTSENSGEGTMEITELVDNASIKIALDFKNEGKVDGFWTFEETDEGVNVTWGFSGDSGYNLIGRYMGLMMDNMVGPLYEAGLASLKEVSEAMPVEETGDMMEEGTEQMTEK